MIPFRWLDLLAVAGSRLAAVLVAPLLLCVTRTRRGRLVGVASILLGQTPVWYLLSLWGFDTLWNGGTAYPRGALVAAWLIGASGCLLSAVGVVGATILLLATLPVYRTDADTGLSSVFLGPTWMHRWQMALPPEDDLLWLGAWLASRLDPWMSRADARQVRAVVSGLLDDMAEYPEYATLAPALGLTLWGKTFRPDHGHFFAYVPDRDPGERLGLLVALHGHGGNAKLWLHVWRAFADEHRLAVVCPSFGYGNWEHPASPAAVERCLNYVLDHYPVDPDRVLLAGLSQGGAGVGRAAAAMPGRFAGLVFLSPTMEPGVLDSLEFVAGWKGRPVLVMQGGRDHNVKPRTVTSAVELMRRNGADVTYQLDPDADHFLFFARLDEMHRLVGDWLTARVPDRVGWGTIPPLPTEGPSAR